MEKGLAFNLYFDSPEFCIIQSIISQDTILLSELLPKNKKVFIFFVISWDYQDKTIFKEWLECLNKDNIRYYLLASDQRQYDELESFGYPKILVNQNCFIDYNLYKITNESSTKLYDVVMNARFLELKRHELLKKINAEVAIISYDHFDEDKEYRNKVLSGGKYHLKENLSADEVIRTLNQSRIGTIFSYREGCCFSSTEYLLCGIPVLSTPSIGGRDVWYNKNNSIICEPNEDSVYESYKLMRDIEWDSQNIRKEAVVLSSKHRNVFIKKTQEIFDEMGYNHVNAAIHFQQKFHNKMIDFTFARFVFCQLHGYYREGEGE